MSGLRGDCGHFVSTKGVPCVMCTEGRTSAPPVTDRCIAGHLRAVHSRRSFDGRRGIERWQCRECDRVRNRRNRAAIRKLYARKRVPNEPLRVAVLAAVEAGDVTWSSVARDVGFEFGTHADTSRLKRVLGVLDQTSGRGWRGAIKSIDWDRAGRIAAAIDKTPLEVGL